jgi:ribosomal protein S18 acetylase RimI-like enzyme
MCSRSITHNEDMDTTIEAPLTIREAVVEDATEIEAVHWVSREAAYRERVSVWPPVGPDKAGRVELWRTWLSDPEIVCIVGERQGEVIGFCTIRASTDDDVQQAGVAEMPTLYVHPDAWHRGYGRALCEEGLVRANERDFDLLTLWVLEFNTRAQRFYREYGFSPDGATKVVEGTPDELIAHRYSIRL